MITAPGAAMLDQKLFVSRLNDPFPDLYERWWDGIEWIWINHGRPEGVRMKGAPGAAMLNEKLFVVTEDGNPLGAPLAQRPRPLGVAGSRSSSRHGRHHAAGRRDDELEAVRRHRQRSPLRAGMDGRSVEVGRSRHGVSRSVAARHRRSRPRPQSQDRVVAAFGLDQLGAHRDGVRLIRIDVISPVTGGDYARLRRAGDGQRRRRRLDVGELPVLPPRVHLDRDLVPLLARDQPPHNSADHQHPPALRATQPTAPRPATCHPLR